MKKVSILRWYNDSYTDVVSYVALDIEQDKTCVIELIDLDELLPASVHSYLKGQVGVLRMWGSKTTLVLVTENPNNLKLKTNSLSVLKIEDPEWIKEIRDEIMKEIQSLPKLPEPKQSIEDFLSQACKEASEIIKTKEIVITIGIDGQTFTFTFRRKENEQNLDA